MRLAKAVGMPEEHARLWLDLANNADLITPCAEEPEAQARGRGRARRPESQPPARMLPTERYDDWLAAPPAQRLLPLVATWAVVPEVFSHWPDEDDTPVALITPEDGEAVDLRHAVLEALATLPAGHGVANGRSARARTTALAALIATAAWFRPTALAQGSWEAERVEATLAEAELLGVVAHGALTPIGHAVLGLLRAGAHRHFPAVPGAGPSLRDRPALDDAVRQLSAALDALLPAPQTTARFQADLTAVVAGASALELTDLLAACADRESEGHAVVWRITPAAVRRALDSGWDAADLLARLAGCLRGRAAASTAPGVPDQGHRADPRPDASGALRLLHPLRRRGTRVGARRGPCAIQAGVATDRADRADQHGRARSNPCRAPGCRLRARAGGGDRDDGHREGASGTRSQAHAVTVRSTTAIRQGTDHRRRAGGCLAGLPVTRGHPERSGGCCRQRLVVVESRRNFWTPAGCVRRHVRVRTSRTQWTREMPKFG